MKQAGAMRVALALLALCSVSAVARAVEVPAIDFSHKDMPSASEIMQEMFTTLGAGLAHHKEVSEEDVKRHLLARANRPSFTVGNLFKNVRGAIGGAVSSIAATNYTDLYERFSDQYCDEPSASPADPPSISLEDALFTTTTYTGPTLGIEIRMGQCSDAGNKTFVCQRPVIVLVKGPATISKDSSSSGFSASKPGGSVTDKQCSWSEPTVDVGHGESAVLYDGGQDTYDYSGYRAALLGSVDARFARVASVYNGIASRMRGRVKLPPLRNILKRRGLKENVADVSSLSAQTKNRITDILPDFFKGND